MTSDIKRMQAIEEQVTWIYERYTAQSENFKTLTGKIKICLGNTRMLLFKLVNFDLLKSWLAHWLGLGQEQNWRNNLADEAWMSNLIRFVLACLGT